MTTPPPHRRPKATGERYVLNPPSPAQARAEGFAAGVAAARREFADLVIRPDETAGTYRARVLALAAIDAIGAGEAHRGSDPYVVPDGLPPTNPPDSNARQENPR